MLWIAPQYRAPSAAAALDDYATLAALAPYDDLVEKQGRSTGRYLLPLGEEPVRCYVKKHFRLPWWLRAAAPLAAFPGPREWTNLQTAAALGVRVPEPVFAGARRRAACGSLLAVRELVGYRPLHEYVPAASAEWNGERLLARRRALAVRLADVARRLHGAHYYHRDFYLCHFFLRDDPALADGFDLVLIDFGRLHRSRLARWRVKDLAALRFSSDLPGVSPRDRLRFFKHYLGVKKLDAAARRLLRCVEAKAERYRCHNERLRRAA